MASVLKETKDLSNRMQGLQLEPAKTADVPRVWVYGFWLKNKHMRRLARDLKLDWDKKAFKVTFKVLRHVLRTTRVYCSGHAVKYRNQDAMIMTFVESHGERNLNDCEFTPKQMDRVRKAIGLPSGTRPKWYEVNGSDYASDQESDSEDEEFPYEYTPNSIFEHEPNHVVSDEFDSDEDGDVSEDIF
ncbi:hypothetical protein ACEPAF_175 [Sanghuangporus sanghuang]